MCILVPFFVHAATLSVMPASGTYSVGERLIVRVVVSGETPLNAVTGTLSFPSDLFAIESVTKAGSILNFWVAEPSFSKQTGVVQFEGVALSGYQGGSGTVLSVGLKAIKTGSGNVTFKSGQVLANDGQGTDITSGLHGGVYVVQPAVSKPESPLPIEVEPKPVVEEPAVVVSGKLNAPEIALAEQDGLMAIKGTSKFAKSDVILTFISSNGSKVFITGVSDGEGSFSLIVPEALKNGPYSVTAIMVLTDGTRSALSENLVVEVGGVFYGDITWQTSTYVLFASTLLLAFCAIYLFTRRYRGSGAKNKTLLKKEVGEAEDVLEKSFDIIREDIDLYEKKNRLQAHISRSGSDSLRALKKDLDDAEKIIQKEIKDIQSVPFEDSK